jgi:aryl-alcohol dehydrogenase-like predicted oxidoreductase
MIHYNKVGNSSLRVSAIGLGCNKFGRSLDLAASRAAIQQGTRSRHYVLRAELNAIDTICAETIDSERKRHGGLTTP